MRVKKKLERIEALVIVAILVTSVFALDMLTAGSTSVATSGASDDNTLFLREGWAIQTSDNVTENGEVISTLSFSPSGWYPTTVPTTILAALVRNGVYPDPYYGTNIESIPGYRAGWWGTSDMPAGSPFAVPWWFRTVFELPADYTGKNIWLHLHSINYKANVWLNGHLIADSSTIEGAYRLFKLDITDYALPGENNCLAFEIITPKDGMDLTITWVDWNPTPPDKAAGIWYDVKITTSDSVEMRHPHVITDLDLPSLDVAHLTISAELTNTSVGSVNGTLEGTIENVNNLIEGGTSEGGPGVIQFSKAFSLAPSETKLVTYTLDISNPRLWWPNNVGTQQLYDLKLDAKVDGVLSDTENVRFGVREISSWMNLFDSKKTRVFQVNGENIVVRGGGYMEDMMLQPSPERDEIEVKYAKLMNLNALRMEGIRGSDYLYDLCDKYGIMTQVGLCCCCSWEEWGSWTDHHADIAEWSWRDEIIRLRNHPCVFTWLYGSDFYPPSNIESRYISVLDTYDGTRPYQSSATDACSTIAGCTGYYMGPWPAVYAYEPPSWWYGKLEFNCECGPSGEQIAPIESMRKMMPESDLWPISDSWDIRLHSKFYPPMRRALNSRYGKPTGVEEYCVKSQVLQKEAVRAMFEAFARNRYKAAGVIFWQYNSAWPALYWQLYDYYLRPNGAFYGAQQACEPLHVMYAYDDGSIYVLNSYYESFSNLTVSAKVYNFDMTEKYSNTAAIDVGPDSSNFVFTIPSIGGLTPVYFLKLELKNSLGELVSSNFYWLSTRGDTRANFTDLMDLPSVDLNVSATLENNAGEYTLHATLENPASDLAFFVNPSVIKGPQGLEVLPTYWSSNYFSMIPGENKEITATFSQEYLDGKDPYLKIEGWNVVTEEIVLVPDTTPPTIENVTASSITNNSAIITWDTDEIADSLVKYGTSPGSYTDNKYDSAYVTSHSIGLTDLVENTTYYYVVKSTDPSNNSSESSEYSFKTLAEALPMMHVDNIEMSLIIQGAFTHAEATVTVVDNENAPVPSATVYGHWENATSDSDSGPTDGNGQVTLQSDTVKKAPSGTMFTFVVDDITKDGWIYDPNANVENSDSITVP